MIKAKGKVVTSFVDNSDFFDRAEIEPLAFQYFLCHRKSGTALGVGAVAGNTDDFVGLGPSSPHAHLLCVTCQRERI